MPLQRQFFRKFCPPPGGTCALSAKNETAQNLGAKKNCYWICQSKKIFVIIANTVFSFLIKFHMEYWKFYQIQYFMTYLT